jgi:hypothetical protein
VSFSCHVSLKLSLDKKSIIIISNLMMILKIV